MSFMLIGEEMAKIFNVNGGRELEIINDTHPFFFIPNIGTGAIISVHSSSYHYPAEVLRIASSSQSSSGVLLGQHP